MEFELSEEQQQIKMSVREFAEAEIAPHVMEWDEAQYFPTELQPKLAELALTGVLFPEEYGGDYDKQHRNNRKVNLPVNAGLLVFNGKPTSCNCSPFLF